MRTLGLQMRWSAMVLVWLTIAAACGAPASSVRPSAGPTAGATAAAESPTPEPATASPTIPTVDVPGNLGEALAYVGPTPLTIDFTDWEAIRAAVGAEDLTGESSFEEKVRAIRSEAPTPGHLLPYLRTFATDWGFDVFDLEWEVAAVMEPRTFIQVLRFRDGFDVDRFTDRLDALEFTAEEFPRGTLRIGSMGVLRDVSPAIHLLNTGLLDDGRTVVATGVSPDPVRAFLTDGPQAVVDPSLRSTAGLLGTPSAATILPGGFCPRVTERLGQLKGEVKEAVDAQLAAAGALHAGNVAAVAYSREPDLVGRFVIAYADVAEAEADLEGRRLLATEGYSLESREGSLFRYTERFFEVREVTVEDRAIVIEATEPEIERATALPDSIGPTELLPRNLYYLMSRHDLLFATCTR